MSKPEWLRPTVHLHERVDADFKGIAKYFIAYFTFMIICAGISVVIFMLFVSPRFDAGSSDSGNRQLPLVTPLQDNYTSRMDIRQFRQQEQGILATPGPSLYHPGSQRIPIEAAINQLSKSGLPNHKPATTVILLGGTS